MTSFRIVPRRTDSTVSAMAPWTPHVTSSALPVYPSGCRLTLAVDDAGRPHAVDGAHDRRLDARRQLVAGPAAEHTHGRVGVRLGRRAVDAAVRRRRNQPARLGCRKTKHIDFLMIGLKMIFIIFNIIIPKHFVLLNKSSSVISSIDFILTVGLPEALYCR